MKKRAITLILAVLMSLSSLTFLSACSNEDEKPEDESFTLEPDSYNMADDEDSFLDKVLETAISGIGNGISSGVSGVVSDVATWAAEGIIKSMGFSYYGEDSYKQEVLNRMQNIESAIVSLEGKIDWLTASYSDNQYLNQYQSFVTAYNELASEASVPYSLLMTVERNIEEGTEKDLNSDLDAICAAVQGVSSTRSKLDTMVTSFGFSFIGSSTSVNKLQKYSIFNIAERFVASQTPYLENQSAKFDEIIADPYSTYYIGVSLVILDYSRRLNDCGVTEYWLDQDGNMIAYRVADGNSVYLNCLSSQKAGFVKMYDAIIADVDLNAAEAKTLNNYNSTAFMIAGYLANITKQYNTINQLYTDFVSRYSSTAEDGSLTLTSLGLKQTTTVKSLAPADFMQTNGNCEFAVKYDTFGNISKSDFINFAKTIEPYATATDANGKAKYLTFREFFEREGFRFPQNNSSSYLILGAEDGKADYDDLYNNGWAYKNCVAICCVDLNMTVHDFVQNESFTRVYYMLWIYKRDVGGTCGSKYEYDWYVAETNNSGTGIDVARNKKYAIALNSRDWKNGSGVNSRPFTFYTIFGLSNHPKTGTTYDPSF